MAKTYSEKLKDPRWQKRRLEILKLDYFTCRACHSKENTLHVHHLKYERGKDPWEYDDKDLITLCEYCHEVAPKIRWQQAFLDLNLCENELLQFALYLKFKKQKHSELIVDVLKKYETRNTDWLGHEWIFDTEEDITEFFRTNRNLMIEYGNSNVIPNG